MRGQGWRTMRQRTAVFRTMRKAQRKGGLALRNLASVRRVEAMLARVGLR